MYFNFNWERLTARRSLTGRAGQRHHEMIAGEGVFSRASKPLAVAGKLKELKESKELEAAFPDHQTKLCQSVKRSRQS